jgi:hypothetical protein
MNVREFASHLRQLVVEVKEKGSEAVNSDSLITYLDNVIDADPSEPSVTELEKYKTQLQLHTEEYRARVETDREAFKAVIQAGQNALRTAFLLNGGSSVALLAVIGKFVTVEHSLEYVPALANSLILFVIGTFLIAFSSAVTYMSQWFHAGDAAKYCEVGLGLNIAAIMIGLSSFGFFLWGMLRAYQAFTAI